MAVNSCTWTLKRYGRFLPGSEGGERGDFKWKDGISLIGATEFLKVERKKDNLLFRCAVKHLTGEKSLCLPLVYHHSPLPPGNLEAFLRACLLDSSFPAFVEEVEVEMRKLLQD
ncbi:hypothetical protein NHX12_006023 [Muraenolepis orangiensis]|uniref:Uncharacterized protein n=1 Tax=Muraenolepis orangiensis TaxID=630683 RepID=A0A9Q0DQA7_9TELE|nr:hypothetical protein NHX12_006023 [Muraenolepis orangiensis]